MFQVIAAIRSAARRKVPDVHGLTAEVFQAGGYGAAQVVREVSKMCLKLRISPLEWSGISHFLPVIQKIFERPIASLSFKAVLSACSKEVSGPVDAL